MEHKLVLKENIKNFLEDKGFLTFVHVFLDTFTELLKLVKTATLMIVSALAGIWLTVYLVDRVVSIVELSSLFAYTILVAYQVYLIWYLIIIGGGFFILKTACYKQILYKNAIKLMPLGILTSALLKAGFAISDLYFVIHISWMLLIPIAMLTYQSDKKCV